MSIDGLMHFLFTRTWWTYNPHGDAYSQPYHWINLIEGCCWMVFAALVLRRHLIHRTRESDQPGHRIEWLYALAFFTFALSDLREAYIVQSWLILFKGANLIALLWLRRIVIHRLYPASKTY